MTYDVPSQILLVAIDRYSISVDIALCLDPALAPPPFLRDLRTLVMITGYIETVAVSTGLIYPTHLISS